MDMLKLLCAVAIRRDDIAVSYEPVLIRYESFKSYRSSGVDLRSRDSYLGSESVTETVSKTG